MSFAIFTCEKCGCEYPLGTNNGDCHQDEGGNWVTQWKVCETCEDKR